ncbi:KPN_02809 family neutral zinc metallopeptidase [Deinococcus maricopensis]|uniref:Metalloprotease n=1 Tax=Deinococcus maricopensis (strain DSM 21211 / LMG 22137 / NRRL B-23946 / LB-34) TaxID=709986 RepID=E8U5C9_DEIML|nr:neutral zinc metallopeptidase [Deinococcus maricopensis]ADV66268.1 protein of unknown function zinc metallopeptidase [Deinococcus maricopensis DSM 21211]
MDWEKMRESANVNDIRGGGGGLPGGGIAVGGGAAILFAIISLLFGGNPGDVLSQLGNGQSQPRAGTGANDDARRFASKVLGSTEDAWGSIFQKAGRTYDPPRLTLFSGGVNTACGGASSAVGPFYCPADQNVYLDTTFFDELANRFGAGGDFAQAYVIAHEVGHHVQNLLGISDRVEQAQRRAGRAQANALSVRLELQADCFAGIWGRNAAANREYNITQQDVQEAVTAAEAIGDDTLSQGRATPDSFTHGTSAQRERWFLRGFQTGNVDQCDTFNAPQL